MKTRLIIQVILLLSFFSLSAAGEEVILIKSDDSWKASEIAPNADWFKPEYEPLSWGQSVASWKNNPCSKYCGKLKSCEVSCIDWMWYAGSCDNCSRFFKKTVRIPGEVRAASLTVSADNSYWLYVNGNFVASEDTKLGYQNAETYDITNLLYEGENVLAIKAADWDEYEGVVVSGRIDYSSGSQIIRELQTQVNTLTEDKKTLQARADDLDARLKTATALNVELQKTVEEMKLANKDLTTKNNTYTRSNRMLIITILIMAIAAGIIGNHVYHRYVKKRKPTLSAAPARKDELKKEGSHN